MPSKPRDRLYRGRKTDPRTLLARTNKIIYMMVNQLEKKGQRIQGKKYVPYSSTDVDMIVKLNNACRGSSKYADADDRELKKQLAAMSDSELRETLRKRLIDREGRVPRKDREPELTPEPVEEPVEAEPEEAQDEVEQTETTEGDNHAEVVS